MCFRHVIRRLEAALVQNKEHNLSRETWTKTNMDYCGSFLISTRCGSEPIRVVKKNYIVNQIFWGINLGLLLFVCGRTMHLSHRITGYSSAVSFLF